MGFVADARLLSIGHVETLMKEFFAFFFSKKKRFLSSVHDAGRVFFLERKKQRTFSLGADAGAARRAAGSRAEPWPSFLRNHVFISPP
jgi:hypothetical protein